MLTLPSKQKGSSLIEILVSMLVISVGVLGILSMQNRSVQFNLGAMMESKATIFAGDIADRIRSNASQASSYRIGLNDSPPSYTDCQKKQATCSAQQIANFDVATWRQEIASSLPEGTGEVTEVPGPGGISMYVITVQYQDSRLEQASASGSSTPKQVIIKTSI